MTKLDILSQFAKLFMPKIKTSFIFAINIHGGIPERFVEAYLLKDILVIDENYLDYIY